MRTEINEEEDEELLRSEIRVSRNKRVTSTEVSNEEKRVKL